MGADLSVHRQEKQDLRHLLNRMVCRMSRKNQIIIHDLNDRLERMSVNTNESKLKMHIVGQEPARWQHSQTMREALNALRSPTYNRNREFGIARTRPVTREVLLQQNASLKHKLEELTVEMENYKPAADVDPDVEDHSQQRNEYWSKLAAKLEGTDRFDVIELPQEKKILENQLVNMADHMQNLK